MQRLGPFEASPHLAVGVSGGRDSMATVLLAAEWAAARGGMVTAVTLDHGLRAESAFEARRVSTWMAQSGIPHYTLTWPDSPRDAREAAARSARYRLLEAFCRDHGILHLLVGHHRDDQWETREMRRARASGALGLAGMPAVRELPQARILRPLLDIARARVTATLQAHGQDWIEDPSNRDLRFARARLRRGRPDRPDEMPGDGPLDGANAARERIVAERDIARLAARSVAVHPAGFATLDPALLRAADTDTAARLIARLVTSIGGRDYAPRGQRLRRLADAMVAGELGGGATLGGCHLQPSGAGLIRVARELAAIAPPCRITLEDRDTQRPNWDGRFRVSISAADGVLDARAGPIEIGAAGQFAARGVSEHHDSPCYADLPHVVRVALPAICQDGRFHVCTLSFSRDSGRVAAIARFAPKNPVAGAVFAAG